MFVSRAAAVLFVTIAAAACSTLHAPPRAVLDARFAQIAAESGRDGKAYEILANITKTKRLSGTEGAASAVDRAFAMMQQFGFENVKKEPIKVPVWKRRNESASVMHPKTGAEEMLRITALGGSPPTPEGGIVAEVVEVQNFEELKNLGERAKGKIIFFNRPFDIKDPEPFQAYGKAVDQRGRGGYEAKKAGALAALVRSVTPALDDHPHTGGMREFMDDQKTPVAPSAAVSTLGARRLQSLLKTAGGPVKLKLTLDCGFDGEADSYNVVGEIVGSALPKEIVVIGGHLDAWDTGFGAHDDGAGCAHSLEALRLLIQQKIRPKRTVRCVLFMNEENGLRGGNGYAAAHAGDTTFFALESDAGGFEPVGFQCVQKEPIFGLLKFIAESLEPWNCSLVKAGGGGADISPLQKKGVVCAEFITDPKYYFNYHHAEIDVLSAVDPDELQRGAAALAFVISAIADL